MAFRALLLVSTLLASKFVVANPQFDSDGSLGAEDDFVKDAQPTPLFDPLAEQLPGEGVARGIYEQWQMGVAVPVTNGTTGSRRSGSKTSRSVIRGLLGLQARQDVCTDPDFILACDITDTNPCCDPRFPICCPDPSDTCCVEGAFCVGLNTCCPIGSIGCGEGCCEEGTTCCDTLCCNPGFECTASGVCTNPDASSSSTLSTSSTTTRSTVEFPSAVDSTTPTRSNGGLSPTDTIGEDAPLGGENSGGEEGGGGSNAAVIGGAVGGTIGGLALIGGIIAFIIFNKRKQKRKADEAALANAAVSAPYNSGGGPPPISQPVMTQSSMPFSPVGQSAPLPPVSPGPGGYGAAAGYGAAGAAGVGAAGYASSYGGSSNSPYTQPYTQPAQNAPWSPTTPSNAAASYYSPTPAPQAPPAQVYNAYGGMDNGYGQNQPQAQGYGGQQYGGQAYGGYNDGYGQSGPSGGGGGPQVSTWVERPAR